jgi:hypothetical protein
LRTVRGEIGIPNLSSSSLAMRSSPHSTFSRAIRRDQLGSSCGIGGRPARDFIRQNNLQPARCQRTIVAGCTTTAFGPQPTEERSSAPDGIFAEDKGAAAGHEEPERSQAAAVQAGASDREAQPRGSKGG